MTSFYIIITHPLSPHNLPNPHYPLLCTITLASLVKGEVLSPEKIRATTGEIASPPSLACTNPSKTALSPSLFVMLTSVCTDTLSHPHYPLPRTMSLPPLSKVRCCRPKKFGRLPEGLSLHQPLQNRTIPCFAPSHLPPLSKGGGLTARHKP